MQIQRIEGSPQVDVEGLIPLTRKNSPAVLQWINSFGCQLFVFRHGASADVRRNRIHRTGSDIAGWLTIALFCDGVALSHEQSFRSSTGQGRDGWQCNIGQGEHIAWLTDFSLEPDLIDDVCGDVVLIVIDMNFV